MRYAIPFALSILLSSSLSAQTSDLFQEHALLTRDCKLVKGHAGRVVAEASETELNRDVALAHAEQISKSLVDMESHLKQARKMLKADQLKAVGTHQEALEKACTKLKALCEDLELELSKEKPDRLAVRKMATELRREITQASDQHETLKRKLGMK